MPDWRLARLREVAEFHGQPGPTCRAFVERHGLLGWTVVRPGVPFLAARESWHLTRRSAERVVATWNAAVDALSGTQR